MEKIRRTAEKFINYNKYQDRPFGLKWGTAFAIEGLVNGIKKNEEETRKQPLPKQQMTLQEIDSILTEVFLSRKAIIIQFNLKDEFGRLLDEVERHFIGEACEDYFMIDHQSILWEDVRYIRLKEVKKWFVTREVVTEVIDFKK